MPRARRTRSRRISGCGRRTASTSPGRGTTPARSSGTSGRATGTRPGQCFGRSSRPASRKRVCGQSAAGRRRGRCRFDRRPRGPRVRPGRRNACRNGSGTRPAATRRRRCTAGYRDPTACAGADEIPARVEVHRAAFAPSKLTVEKYERLQTMPHYTTEDDLVVEAPDGSLAAFAMAGGIRRPTSASSSPSARIPSTSAAASRGRS